MPVLPLCSCQPVIAQAICLSGVYWCRLQPKHDGVEQSRRIKLPIFEHQRQMRTAQPA